MKWLKKGVIFTPDHNYEWMVSHASLPLPLHLENGRLRIYFGTRDGENRTTVTFIEVDAEDPAHVLYVHDRQVLALGKLGCFDDSGVTPSWVVEHESKKYLYYIGHNIRKTIPYHNSIGLAVSHDNGLTFERLHDGPILDRTHREPYFTASSCVLRENGTWRMWYLTTVRWEYHEGYPEPYYHLKYAESKDGIQWERNGIVCIDFKSADEGGISRPCVIKGTDCYQMWYSYRKGKDYRTNRDCSYRIGYAESDDGIHWHRKDEHAGVDVSESGWDADMIEYPYVYEYQGKKFMLYNGNGFGKSGLGYAILDEDAS